MTKELVEEARERATIGADVDPIDAARLLNELADALEATLGEPSGDGELIEYALDYIENGTMRPGRRAALRALAARATVPDSATEELNYLKSLVELREFEIDCLDDLITEIEAERDTARAEIESRIEDRDYWYGIANVAAVQRDVANEDRKQADAAFRSLKERTGKADSERIELKRAIERVRAVLVKWEERQELNREILGSGGLGHLQAIDCTGDLRAALEAAALFRGGAK